MKLKHITCSGANEHTDIIRLMTLVKDYPLMEIGVQVSGQKAERGTARYWWLYALYLETQLRNRFANVALHVNSNWVERFGQGNIAPELLKMFLWKNADGTPFIKRVQLNFKIGREKTPDMERLILLVKKFSKQRFIFSYNPENADFIHRIYETGLRDFDLLYDSSHGEGILANSYLSPVYDNILQGYAGGFSPENVGAQLREISKVVAPDQEIYIDAEGKLKGDDRHFSIRKCERYLEEASKWQ